MIKKIFLLFLLGLISTHKVSAQEATVLVINQIRGEETCCQPGNLQLIEMIKNNHLDNLPVGWAIRYDALKNKDLFINLQKNGELGLLLEVTPNLAKESGVIYKGKDDGSDWYYAKNAFLVGYAVADRKKIIDTLMASFKKEFGYYPQFTVAWMIDAWSLNYIDKTYSVKLHELTKEQYETDSYTLYGGIFNVPYYPSDSHPLIPGNIDTKLNLIIVRQTISDLLKNYGSGKSYFTSQPNDYLQNPDEHNFNYFQKLIEQSLSQNNPFRFALIGFENSFSWDKYGEEYIKQLKYISRLWDDKKLLLKKPSEYALDFIKNNPENKPFILKENFSPGVDLGVLWYFGKNYRARIIVKNNRVILDDLRSFLNIDDPYITNKAMLDYTYWIIPYLIDGSQMYTLSPEQTKELQRQKLLSDNTISDLETNPFGIILGEGQFNLIEDNLNVVINFKDKNSGKVNLLPDKISIDKNLNPSFNEPLNTSLDELSNYSEIKKIKFNKHYEFYLKPNNGHLELGWVADNIFVPLFNLTKENNNFVFQPTENNNLDILKPIFQPDKGNLSVDSNKSIFYWNNKEAIAARNPVRLFILPLNKLGRPTAVSDVKVNLSNNNGVKITFPSDYTYRITPWFIDITSENPQQINLSLLIDGVEVIKGEKIEFIADCRKKIRFCLTSAPQIIKYISAIVKEQKIKLFKSFDNL